MADTHTDSKGLAEPLTEREQEILAWLAQGLSNREIANRLHLAHRTVTWYNTQIYSKLGVNNRDDAVIRAQELGLSSASTTMLQETSFRHNLPAQTTSFVGRRQELTDLTRLMREADTRLVTILAPGGMGKTRLAVVAAEQQLRQFSDGVFFVPLAPLSSSDDIVTAIAENIGLNFYGSDPPRQQLLSYLRNRQMLLLLDNFEHLLDGTSLVTDLLQAAPKIKVLTTSREKLNLSSETVFTLAGMHLPEWETADDLLNHDCIHLFIQSARHARPDYELQADNFDYLARICRLTEGMPLALVLAAGWLDVLTMEQIAAEIQQGISILETDQRDVPERQRSVQATFNYSWNRLADADRMVFMKLSVFRGGFTAEAVQNVTGADVRNLRKLVNKALIHALPTGRYEVHELLRQFGEAHLMQTDSATTMRQSHSTYYMDFLATRDEDIKGRRQQAGLQEIQTDFENIRRAWLWATDQNQYEPINQGVDCLINFGEMQLNAQDVIALLQHTLVTLDPSKEPVAQYTWDRVRVRLERIKYMLANEIEAEPIHRILDRVRALNDEVEIAYCLWMLGDHAHVNGNYELQKVYHTESLVLRQKVNDPYYIAHAHTSLHAVYFRDKNYDLALASVYESLRIRRAINDHCNIGFSLGVMAFQLIMFGQCEEAEIYVDEGLEDSPELGSTRGVMILVAAKAVLVFWRGQFELAEQLENTGQRAEGRDYFVFKNINDSIVSWIVSVQGDYQRGLSLSEQVIANKRFDWELALITWGHALALCGLDNHSATQRAIAEVLHISLFVYKSLVFEWLCLPLAAILAARSKQHKRATELLGLAYAAPAGLTGWYDHWSLLVAMRADLERELGLEDYTAIFERGSQLDLDTVVETLLTDFSDVEDKC